MLAQVLLREDQHLFHELDQVRRRALQGTIAGIAQHAADDGRRPLASLEDFAQGFGTSGLVALGAQPQLRIIDEGGQDVVEFMGHAGRQGAHAAEPLRMEQLLPELVGFGTGSHYFLARHEVPPVSRGASWVLAVLGLGWRAVPAGEAGYCRRVTRLSLLSPQLVSALFGKALHRKSLYFNPLSLASREMITSCGSMAGGTAPHPRQPREEQ